MPLPLLRHGHPCRACLDARPLRRGGLRLLALAALAAGPAVALSPAPPAQPEPEQAIRVSYLCRGRFDAVELQALFFNRTPAEVVLLVGESALRLPRLPAADGSRYGAGGSEFWIRGDQASWRLGAHPAATMQCATRPTQSQR